MPVVDPSTLTIGQVVRFKSISSHDNVLWAGTILSICLYDAVIDTEDVVPYYREVCKTHPELPTLQKLTFLQLALLENYEQRRSRFFAREWIDPSTLQIVEVANTIDFRVYDTTQEQTATILELLRSHGYTVSQIT